MKYEMTMKLGNRRYTDELSAANDGERVCIAGWVHEKRDLGGVFFLIIRDLKGLAQVTLHRGNVDAELFKRVKRVPRESVVAIEGRVKSEEKAPAGYEIIPELSLIHI